ncbi:MAG TPA: hypothetical protein VJ691_17005 [Vicinamibacterales bacterium]|nr:hypothetical protein [Vicinamibacterales bacterium]
MKLSAASLPVCLALFAVACQRDSRPPTAPTATPAIQSQTIAGVVLDIVATPVSGASVEIVGASDHA